MFSGLVQFFSQFPPEIATILLSATPVGELRLGLPVALLAYHLPVWQAYFLAVFGNMLPVLVILLFADKFHSHVSKNSGFIFGKAWLKTIKRAQEKFAQYEKYGLLGLMLFVAVPIPGTGAYTGALIAFVLGVPFKHSWPFLLGGVMIAGFITTIVSLGAGKVF